MGLLDIFMISAVIFVIEAATAYLVWRSLSNKLYKIEAILSNFDYASYEDFILKLIEKMNEIVTSNNNIANVVSSHTQALNSVLKSKNKKIYN